MNQLLTISGLNSSYHQVYEALRHLKTEDSNKEKMFYGLIKAWLDQNYTNNPGSFIDYRECQNPITLNLSFEYCLSSPKLSRDALRYSLPIITLDVCSTKGQGYYYV